jgi:hypothetical protein
MGTAIQRLKYILPVVLYGSETLPLALWEGENTAERTQDWGEYCVIREKAYNTG